MLSQPFPVSNSLAMIHPALQIPLGLLFVVGLMSLLWFVQRRTGNAGIVDVAWAAAIGLLGLFFAVDGCGRCEPTDARGFAHRTMVASADRLPVSAGLWDIPRKVDTRRFVHRWGEDADRRFFRFYQMQAIAAFTYSRLRFW